MAPYPFSSYLPGFQSLGDPRFEQNLCFLLSLHLKEVVSLKFYLNEPKMWSSLLQPTILFSSQDSVYLYLQLFWETVGPVEGIYSSQSFLMGVTFLPSMQMQIIPFSSMWGLATNLFLFLSCPALSMIYTSYRWNPSCLVYSTGIWGFTLCF